MKMLKLVLAFVCILLVTVRASPLQSRSPLNEISIIYLEEACVRQGGMCQLTQDCDPANLVQIRGVLCPQQRHLGVECCYV